MDSVDPQVDTQPNACRDGEAIGAALLAAGVLLAATAVLKWLPLSTPWRLLVALLPVPAYIYLVVAQVKAISGLDELQRRIYLEALVFAFPTTFLTILTAWMLHLAHLLPGLTLSDAFPGFLTLMALFYVVGRFLAGRRYR